MRKKLIPVMALVGLGLVQSGAMAADTGSATQPRYAHHEHGGPRASIERAAMDNLLAAELAQSTGRDQADISQRLERSPPSVVANELGVSHETMMQAMQTAHASLIQKALAAGLITDAQAQKLSAMPAPPPPPPQQ
jgi:hypothetical protein